MIEGSQNRLCYHRFCIGGSDEEPVNVGEGELFEILRGGSRTIYSMQLSATLPASLFADLFNRLYICRSSRTMHTSSFSNLFRKSYHH